jgi:hypothetical protein
LNHTPDEDLNLLTPDREYALLKEATVTLEDAMGEQISSFRAPCWQISKRTLPILDQLGYKADLSVTPQQISLFSSSPWDLSKLWAPRSPYYPSDRHPFRHGDLGLLEIPTSCLGIPFAQASILAIPRVVTGIMMRVLVAEAARLARPVVLQLHPESVVGKDDYKFPPLRLRDFIPLSSGGFNFRYKLIERDPVKVQELTDCLLRRLRTDANLHSISVDDFLANTCVSRSAGNQDEPCSDEKTFSSNQLAR